MGVVLLDGTCRKGVEGRMIRSMTGYGRGQNTASGLNVVVELKAVNHRFFDYSSRLPRAYAFLDSRLKSLLQASVSRGKVEAFVQIESLETGGSVVMVNMALADSYVQAMRQIAGRYGLLADVTVEQLSRFPEVLSVRQAGVEEEAAWEAVQPAAAEALAAFTAMRENEGARLRDDVLTRADLIEQAVAQIEQRSPETVREHMSKMEARLRELLDGAPVDEARLVTEAAVYADKIAVAEETVRLRSHLAQLRQMVTGDGAVGRKLDFLVQELNREANTIGSKCCDLALTRLVVDMKTEIEKIREQIQNIE